MRILGWFCVITSPIIGAIAGIFATAILLASTNAHIRPGNVEQGHAIMIVWLVLSALIMLIPLGFGIVLLAIRRPERRQRETSDEPMRGELVTWDRY